MFRLRRVPLILPLSYFTVLTISMVVAYCYSAATASLSNVNPSIFDEVMLSGLLIVLGMFALFIVLGRKLWSVHYPDSKSRTGFMVYLTLIFWVGLALTIMLV